ncbi:MAG: anthranilate phosphoribosyltransferase [Pseudomonadales bacterium]|nr:anthranilate phosphoribosyltransferase [Pseudomonadales bacterium]
MIMADAFSKIIAHKGLTEMEMSALMRGIMTGEASPAQIGGLLMGLAVKGETVDEITGAAQVMRELATPVNVGPEYLVDTCGTGGDGSTSFNISTTAALVVAAAGGRVAKHGNRAVSSRSGSADVLEAAGVHLQLLPEQVARCIDTIGVGFLFAPRHHSATRYAVAPRQELGVRTLFNLLGPLTNPARAPNQVMGVYAQRWLRPLAEVLHRLGSRHVMMVHSEDGMDEISISAATSVVEMREGKISEYTIAPEDFGLSRADRSLLHVASVQESLEKMKMGLQSGSGAISDIVALNAGAALYVSGVVLNLHDGVLLAQDVQASGQASEKLRDLVAFTQIYAGQSS